MKRIETILIACLLFIALLPYANGSYGAADCECDTCYCPTVVVDDNYCYWNREYGPPCNGGGCWWGPAGPMSGCECYYLNREWSAGGTACPDKCEGLTWVTGGEWSCLPGGWQCFYSSGEECSPSGCCDAECDPSKGCELKPNDSNCGGENCDSDTCKCEEAGGCSANHECGDGACCDADSHLPSQDRGDGNCYDKGYIYKKKYLCDPGTWMKCSEDNIGEKASFDGKNFVCQAENSSYNWVEIEQKSVIDLAELFSRFFASLKLVFGI